MTIKATVIIPTFDHGQLIEYAIESVKNQTIKEIEIFVIGDGAPDLTRQLVENHAQQDPRIKYIAFQKDSRHGEIYRDQVIREQAKGEIVCYLSDDDLWLPNHLEVMCDLLSDADYAHTLPVLNYPDRGWEVNFCDLSLPFYRKFIINQYNLIPLSGFGHTRDMYKKLPYGWRTTPQGVPTDYYMYQQILSESWVRAKSSFEPTFMHFPSSSRRDWTVQKRDAELKEFYQIIHSEAEKNQWRHDLMHLILKSVLECHRHHIAEHEQMRTELNAIKNTKTWKMHFKVSRWLANLPMKTVKT